MPGPTNDFLAFCPTNTGTNLPTQVAYAADPQLLIGNQPGVARSILVNKALRQATYMANCLAQFLANATGDNLLDNATPAQVIATLTKALRQPPTRTNLTAGAAIYTVPVNATYLRIRGQAAGGGGGISGTNNGGTGGDTLFGPGAGGTGLLLAQGAIGRLGRTASLGVGPIGMIFTGGIGQGAGPAGAPGGMGAASQYGGAGAGGDAGVNSVGASAEANTGSGGGGATAAAGAAGQGGGCGGAWDCIITPAMACWAATFNYAVGIAGPGGAGGFAGGSGGSGLITIDEFYS